MSVPAGKLPAQISPLGNKGISLDTRSVNATGGVLSFIDDYLRPPNKAKRIRNFHQFSRGVFSSSGGGWQRDNAAGLNGGTSGLGFGTYYDALGAAYLLAQVGTKLYTYQPSVLPASPGTGAGTQLVAGLSATALPCIRPTMPTAATTTPFSVYCNGVIEPLKLFNTAAGAAPNTSATLGFNSGFTTQTITVTGTITNGDIINITTTSTALKTSPNLTKGSVSAGQTTSDVATTIATQLTNSNYTTAGITTTANANVVTVSYPIGTPTVTFSIVVSGAATEVCTVAPGPATPTWPGVFNGLTYTKPGLCAPFLNRMAYCQFDNGGASGNQVANQLLISALGSAEMFTQSTPTRATDAWSIPIPPILGKPTAMTAFRPKTNISVEMLIIGCRNGMCIVTGTDASSFSLQVHSMQFGIPSNRTFNQIDNSMLFMATDGFRIYDGADNTTTLLTDSLSLDIYDEFKKVDRTNWQKSHAVHHRDTQEVWFWVPYTGPDGNPAHGDNGQPQHAFIYQYNTLDGNPIWYFKDNTICMDSIEFGSTFFGLNDIGLVQRWYGCNNYDDPISGVGGATNIMPGSEIVLASLGVGNPAQFCSIEHVVVGTSTNDQKCLINAATYETMDNGATRKQQMQPINYLIQSPSIGQTVLGVASPSQWTLNQSAFPSLHPKFLSDYVPLGHGRLWEFSLICNDSSHNLDFSFIQATISIGGQRV